MRSRWKDLSGVTTGGVGAPRRLSVGLPEE